MSDNITRRVFEPSENIPTIPKERFNLSKIRTLSPNDAKTYITNYFIPLNNGNHAFYDGNVFSVRDDKELKQSYFSRMPKELQNYYFRDYLDVRQIAFDVNKQAPPIFPCLILNLYPFTSALISYETPLNENELETNLIEYNTRLNNLDNHEYDPKCKFCMKNTITKEKILLENSIKLLTNNIVEYDKQIKKYNNIVNKNKKLLDDYNNYLNLIESKKHKENEKIMLLKDNEIYNEKIKNLESKLKELKQINNQLKDSGTAVGLNYQFNKIIVANSMQAHNLLHEAKIQGKQHLVKENLFQAYFEFGKNIDDQQVLTEIAQISDMDLKSTKQAIISKLHWNAIQTDIIEAQQLGVRGVPFFVFNRKFAIRGAQELNIFTDVLEETFRDSQ